MLGSTLELSFTAMYKSPPALTTSPVLYGKGSTALLTRYVPFHSPLNVYPTICNSQVFVPSVTAGVTPTLLNSATYV